MSTITKEFTKEQLIAKAREQIAFCRNTKITGEGRAHVNQCSALFEIALASIEAEKNAEPVAKVETIGVCWYADNGVPRKPAVGTELYSAPPAPVSVPTFEEWCERTQQNPLGWVRDAMKEAYDGCRAAMLQGAEPVTTGYKLPFDKWLSQQYEPVDVDCGCVTTEAFNHWLRVAYEAGNSPVIPDGWVTWDELQKRHYLGEGKPVMVFGSTSDFCSKHPQTKRVVHPYMCTASMPPQPCYYCPECEPDVAEWEAKWGAK